MPKYDSIIDIKEILNEYSYDVQDAITEDAQKIAKEGVSELKVTSPKRPTSGKYAKGWRVKTTKGNGFINCTIHNTQYQLTHLLEYGHDWVGRDGRRIENAAKAIEHIKPVEQKCIRQFESDVEKIVKNGG